MKFKKLRKIYRIIFPKKNTASAVFKYKLEQNKEIVGFKKDNIHYLITLNNSLVVKMRNENHSDYLVFEQVFNFKQYEIIISLLNLNYNEKNIIIDAGANVAYTSLFFSRTLKNSSIYAIEPSIENALVCRENISLNGLEKEIKFYQRAISHKKGLKYKVSNNFRDTKDWAIVTCEDQNGSIEGITLNEIVENHNLPYISLLKIDIEGAERFIFEIDNDLSFLNVTKIIAIEIHDEFDVRFKIYKILREFGFYLFESGELTIGINTKRI